MIRNLKFLLSITSAKTLIWLIKTTGQGAGTSLPGKIALKICPEVLKNLAKQTKKEILTVTGTNGKTTTSGFIAGILKADGRNIVHNRHGANMLTGITTAVIDESNFIGKIHADNCLFEIDEAYLVKAVDEFSPDVVLVTNLFRDQLDRYGELNTTAKKINQAIEKTALNKIPKIILNADDPIVASLGEKFCENKLYYGFEEIKLVNQDEKITSPQETTNCFCGRKFKYDKVFYGHLGYFFCECGNKRPSPQITAKAVIDVNSSFITVNVPGREEFSVKINMPGLYNSYNALAAISMGIATGISSEKIVKGLENYSTVFGRAEKIKFKGKEVLIQLIKNPIGATEVLRTVKDDDNGRLLVIINDNYADGRDVSWLWDANFELLKNHKKPVYVSGVRASDMAVRLKYAGIPAENIIICEEIKPAIETALKNTEESEKLYILPTYTALLEMQKFQKDFI